MAVVIERRFRAMGSDAHLVVVGGPDQVLDAAERRIERLEQLWSRFIDTSEICELNRRAGDDVTVSAETALLVERAIEAWRLTGGGFDPTVLGAVLRAGYDVSFDDMPADKSASASSLLIGCTDIRVEGCTVRLPPGTGFDPGGIGKGLAADLVIGDVLAAGARRRVREPRRRSACRREQPAGRRLDGRRRAPAGRRAHRARRSARRRHRHLDDVAPAVERRRSATTPPHRPVHRGAVDERPRTDDGDRRRGMDRRGAGQGGAATRIAARLRHHRRTACRP